MLHAHPYDELTRFSELNKQPAALVQSCCDPRNYYIMYAGVAKGLDQKMFIIKGQTPHGMFQRLDVDQCEINHRLESLIQPVSVDARALDTRIPRPRNSFMLYRIWMSSKIIIENPGLTAGCICKY